MAKRINREEIKAEVKRRQQNAARDYAEKANLIAAGYKTAKTNSASGSAGKKPIGASNSKSNVLSQIDEIRNDLGSRNKLSADALMANNPAYVYTKAYGDGTTGAAANKVIKRAASARDAIAASDDAITRNNPAYSYLQREGATTVTRGSDAITENPSSVEWYKKILRGIDTGLTSFGQSLTSLADVVTSLGDESGGPLQELWYMFGGDRIMQDNPVKALNKLGQSEVDYRSRHNASLQDDPFYKYSAMLGETIPMLVPSIMTGGATAFGEAAGAASELAATSKVGQTASNLGKTYELAKKSLKNLASRPDAQTIFGSVLGSSYDEAKQDGADDGQALTYAILNGVANTVTELGGADTALGGLQNLPSWLKNAIEKGDKSLLLNYAKSVGEEASEELIQGILGRGFKSLYSDVPLYDPDNENSIINPEAAIDEATGAAVVTTLLGLPTVGINAQRRARQNRNAKDVYGNSQQELVNEGLQSNQSSESYELAQKYNEKLSEGKKLSGNELYKLAKANEDAITQEQTVQSAAPIEANTPEIDVPEITDTAVRSDIPYAAMQRNAPITAQTYNAPINFGGIQQSAQIQSSVKNLSAKYNVSDELIGRVYNLNPTAPQAFETAFNAVYQMGQQGTDKAALGKVPVLNTAQASIAYQMGADSVKAANVSTDTAAATQAATPVQAAAPVTNNNIQEVNDNGVRIHNVEERINGQNTEGQIRGVETGTGENDAGGSQKEQGGISTAEIKTGEKVSYKGKQQKGVYYAAEDTEGMKKGRKLAESYGYKVTYFVGGNIRYAGGEFRGAVDTAKKTVMVRADHPDYTAGQIMRHEMGHAAFENGDLSLNEAKEMLLGNFTEDELNELIEIYSSEYGGILSPDEAFEEMCCDALGRMNIFEGTDLNSENYGKAQDTVRKYAAERTGSKGRAPPKGGVKYSREASLTNATKAIQNMGRKSINEFTSADIEITRPFAEKYWREMGTKSPFFRAWFGDWRANDKTAAAVVNVGGGSFKAGKAVNKDTGTVLSWGDVLKKETIVHQSSGGVASRALGAIEDIVENAILLDTYTSSLSSKTKLPGTAFMHSYYTVANYEGTDYLLKLFAEEAVSLKNGEIFTRAYELKDIKKVAALPNGVLSQTGGLTDGNTSTTLTVADIAAIVKKYDKSYNPKPASKVVNEDGTPKIVYHQTENEFTVFEMRREGAGTRDNGTPFGIFLKSSNKDIGLRGKKQMALYARIESPLRAKNRSELLKAMQSMSSEYVEIINRHEALDREYKEKTQSAMREFKNYMIEWRADNPGVDSRALYDDAKFNELFEAEDTLASEWTEKADMLSTKAKEALTKALESNGYDGVIIERDDGSFGRSTDAYIALRPEQVKSATDNIGTFDSSIPDIRYSREPERLNELRRQNERKLAQATAEDAANENERGLIRDYQKQYSKVEDIREKLSAAQQTLTEAEDSGADYDTTTKAKNRFTVLSNQYAREHRKLESYAKMKALQNVLTRVDERLGNDLPEGMGAASANFTGEETVGERWVTEAQGEGDSALHPISKEQEANLAEQQHRAPQEIPKEDLNGKLTSKHVSTIANSGMTPAEFSDALREDAALGKFSHIAYSDEEALKKANRTIEIDGWEQALANYKAEINSGRVSKDNTVMGIALYDNAVNSGDYATAMDIASLMVKNSTNTAQSLQAMRILNKLSPECRLYLAAKSIENIEEDLNERYKDNKADIHVDKILYDEYAKALRQGNEDGIKTAWANIEQSVAQQIDATWYEKLNNFRYLAMLGNPRTHVRNFLGNALFTPVREVKNIIAYGIENMVDAKIDGGIERSKAILNSSNATDKALIDYGKMDYAAMQDVILSGGKYNDNFSGIDNNRTIYDKVKPLEKLRKANSKALDKEDAFFCKNAYAYALARWYKSNGISAEQLLSGQVADETVAKAQAIAVKEAQKATYRDINVFSQWVSNHGKTRYKAVNVLVEGILPFKKTPANILARGMEYSPVGLMKSLWDIRRVKAYVNGDVDNGMSPAEFIDEVSAGLTGTALVGLGVLLAWQGFLLGGSGDDDKQSKFDELSGNQKYALDCGSFNITLDWLAPECLPVFVGVELYNSLSGKNDSANVLDGALKSLASVTTPVLEMSMLQSVSDLINNIGYVDDASGMYKILSKSVTSYLTQYFPTILGQAERTFEETQREMTYVDRNSAASTELQYMWGKIANKIPLYDFSQIPYIDAWGRTEETGNFFVRALNNFVNPAYVKKERPTEIDGELERLYDLGETSVYPSRAKTNTKINGEYLTADEYVKYATTKGQTSYELAQGVINSAAYSGAADPEKAYMLKYVYSYADHIAKYEVNNDYSLAKWEMAAYKSANPMQAIIDHAREKYNPDKEN